MKTYFMVDVESNGPIPGDYSMTSLGAVVVDGHYDKTFTINIKPISEKYEEKRLRFVDSEGAVDAREAMTKFNEWVKKNSIGRPIFVSDNNGYDWMFVCWYCHHFLDKNPFGFSSQNMQSIYRGMNKDMSVKINDIRKRELTHDALEDAKDNARIFYEMLQEMENK